MAFGPTITWRRDGNDGDNDRLYFLFLGSKIIANGDCHYFKNKNKKDTFPLEEKL